VSVFQKAGRFITVHHEARELHLPNDEDEELHGYCTCTFDPLKPCCYLTYSGLTKKHSTFCPQTVFMCFVWIWEQTTTISLCSI